MIPIIRPGHAGDSDWICALLSEGARQGHFMSTVAVQAPHVIKATVTAGGFTMIKLRGRVHEPAFVGARLTVAEVEGVPASFLVTLQHDDHRELHLAGTLKVFRRLGAYRFLIEDELQGASPGTVYIARCYRKSTWAANGLKALGFVVSQASGNPIELTKRV